MRLDDLPEYSTWRGMRSRCEQPKDGSYRRYGARGIKVCERWKSFANFLSDMGSRPDGASIDRIDPDGDYEPGNCRWATLTEQARNKRSVPLYEVDGVKLSVAGWAERLGVPSRLIDNRLRRGWAPRKAILTPTLPVGTKTRGA